MFNGFMIKECLDCKNNVNWKLLQLISRHVSVVRLRCYKSDAYQMYNEYANNSQIKLPNQMYQGDRVGKWQ